MSDVSIALLIVATSSAIACGSRESGVVADTGMSAQCTSLNDACTDDCRAIYGFNIDRVRMCRETQATFLVCKRKGGGVTPIPTCTVNRIDGRMFLVPQDSVASPDFSNWRSCNDFERQVFDDSAKACG